MVVGVVPELRVLPPYAVVAIVHQQLCPHWDHPAQYLAAMIAAVTPMQLIRYRIRLRDERIGPWLVLPFTHA